MKKIYFLLFAFVLFLFFVSCSKNDDNTEKEGKENAENTESTESTATFKPYMFKKDGASSVEYDDQKNLVNKEAMLKDALGSGKLSDGTTAITEPNLEGIYSDIKATVPADVTAKVEEYITTAVSEILPNWNVEVPSDKKGVDAGKIKRGKKFIYVSKKGFEMNQAVSKLLIGGLTAHTIKEKFAALETTDNESMVGGKKYTAMEHLWDEAYGIMYGSSGDDGNPLDYVKGGSEKRSPLAGYTSVLNSDEYPKFKGIAVDVFNAFRDGRQAIVDKKTPLAKQKADFIQEKLALVIAARAVHYVDAGAGNDDLGDGLHALSEALGFIRSLMYVKDPKLQKSELKAFYDRMLEDNVSNPESNGLYGFDKAKATPIATRIAGAYGFTVAESHSKDGSH